MPDLSRRYSQAQIVFSGGTDPPTRGASEAAIAKQFFISCGIAPDRISIEERSRNIKENAQFTAQLIHATPQSHWLLVTPAYHMPRAMGFPKRRVQRNRLSGWLAHPWLARLLVACDICHREFTACRCCCPRMGRSAYLSASRILQQIQQIVRKALDRMFAV